jgi:putative glutamine amidotransferase
MGVNTAHHQGIKKPGKDLIVNAVADDNLIEGIEHKTHKFLLGVQWHPEYQVTPGDFKIIEAFVNACK